MQKVAVVTGSSKGLGREIAIALSKQGYIVVIHYNKSKQEALKTLNKVKINSPKSILASADLKSELQVEKMFKNIFSQFKNIDLLVNNVGNFLYKPFNKTTNNEFRDVLESNIYSTLYCSRQVLPVMRKQKSGHIINIGSVGAEYVKVLPNSTPYFISKSTLYSMTKIMAWEEAKNGIHINMISPASLEEDIFKKEDFPMGRSAKYEDVTKALLFLISKDAYYINGGNLEVSGGFIPGIYNEK